MFLVLQTDFLFNDELTSASGNSTKKNLLDAESSKENFGTNPNQTKILCFVYQSIGWFSLV